MNDHGAKRKLHFRSLRRGAAGRGRLRVALAACGFALASAAGAAESRMALDEAWREFFFQMYDSAERLFAQAQRAGADAALRREAEIGAAMVAQFRETGGNADRAIAAYERLLREGIQGPPRALCLCLLAEAYALQGRDADADRLWDEAIAGYPELPIAQDALLRRTVRDLRDLRSERAGAAIRYLEERRKLFPPPTPEAPGLAPAFDFVLGEAYFWRGDLAAARAAWKRYIATASPRVTSYSQYAGVTLRAARVSEQLGEPAEAGRYYRRFVEQTPNDARAYFALERAVALGALNREEVVALRLYGLSEADIDRLFAGRESSP